MLSENYWRKRYSLIEKEAYKNSIKLVKEIENNYKYTLANIEKDIAIWYQRFADNNGVSKVKAYELIKSNELVELGWSVEEYIEYGKKNVFTHNLETELENASAKFHITRLEALKLQLQQHCEKMFGDMVVGLDNTLKDIYETGYYKSIFEIQKGFDIYFNVTKIDDKMLDMVINKPWADDGTNFSDRIWGKYRPTLVNRLHKGLTDCIIRGTNPQELTKGIVNEFKVAQCVANRLVMSEYAYFNSLSTKNALKELDVEEFEVVETLDNTTCATCGDMDGKHYPMDEYEIGLTAPPFHPNCRGTTCPYFDDEFDLGERAARDKDDKTYYVPGDMTYKEWKEKFVDNDQFTSEGNGSIIEKDIPIMRSVGAAAYRDEVKLLNGYKGKIVEGSKITKVITFAGKGTNKPVKVAKYLSKEYVDVPESEWKKCRGDGYVEYEKGDIRHVELHWFESKQTGRIKMKVKREFKDDES